MASESKPRLSERGYGILGWIGYAVVAAVAADAVASFLAFFFFWDCSGEPLSSWNATEGPAPLCAAINLFPNWIVMVIVLIIGAVVAFYAFEKRSYWFREVPEGKVVRFGWYSSAGMATSGYEKYSIAVRGQTRSGDTRVFWHSVQPKTYHDYQVGDDISFS